MKPSRLAMAQRKDRVSYVHNLGLMQYHYGIPLADPPIPVETVPYPGGVDENFEPFPGGDINYNAPLEALAEEDMHLTWQGYDILAQRCIDEYYADWLSWPVVLEILPLTTGAEGPFQFQVTFSEAVTGVDETDFDLAVLDKAEATLSVTGDGAVYTVTVSDYASLTPPELVVLDDDSIIDGDSQPLGGTGANNGGFDFNGPMAYADPPTPDPDDFDTAITPH